MGTSVVDYMKLKEENRALNHREIRAGKLRIESMPLIFWLDVCGACNLKCRHCGFQIHGRTSEEEMSDKLYDTVVKTLMPTAYECHLGGTNYGEMTIAKKFHQVLKDCHEYQVKINLTTNGILLRDSWLDDLTEVLTVIGFSMEGMDEQYEHVRGRKWSAFLKNVERVIQARNDRGKSFRVQWRYCAHAGNIHQLPEMIRLAHKLGVDGIQMMNLMPVIEAHKFANVYYHRSLANRYFAEGRAVSRELSFDVNIPEDFDLGSLVTSDAAAGQPSARAKGPSGGVIQMEKCYQPWQRCSINELGVVRACCVHWKAMGNLNRGSFRSIWNGRRYRRLRRTVNTRPDRICLSCRMPRFDSDQNVSALQLAAGVRDLIRGVLGYRGRKATFTEGKLEDDSLPGESAS